MRWLTAPVTKWLLILVTALMLLGALRTMVMVLQKNSTYVEDSSTLSYVQLGFYDRLSGSSEIYDLKMWGVRQGFVINLTSPQDSNFIFRGKFNRLSLFNLDSHKLNFSYTPIYENKVDERLMINGLTQEIQHSELIRVPLNQNGQQLAIGKNGMIIRYPLKKEPLKDSHQ